jgi:hypothetical protein
MIRERNTKLLQRLAEWAAPHSAANRIVDASPVVLLALILGPAHAVARAWLSDSLDLDDQVTEQVAAAAARTVSPPGVGRQEET